MTILVRHLVFASAALVTATACLFASSTSQAAPVARVVDDGQLAAFRFKLDKAIDRIQENLELFAGTRGNPVRRGRAASSPLLLTKPHSFHPGLPLQGIGGLLTLER